MSNTCCVVLKYHTGKIVVVGCFLEIILDQNLLQHILVCNRNVTWSKTNNGSIFLVVVSEFLPTI